MNSNLTRPRVLIFTYHQFGSHIGTFKYCQYGRDQFDITYLGWDYGREKASLEGVNVIYVDRKGSVFHRNRRLLACLNKEIRSKPYDAVFFQYTRGISIIKLLNLKQKFVFDVRTLSIDRSPFKRYTFNFFLKFESLFFKHRSVISDGLARQMSLKSYFLLPLGADRFISDADRFDRNRPFRLLYTGTLLNRDIIKCVIGFHRYLEVTSDTDIEFIIVGDSYGDELTEIQGYIERNPILHNRVICTGRITYSELSKYFSTSDVGVSFIPMTKWYDQQPPTKTYEYLLSNLSVIATKTYENIKVLKDDPCSILINDTSEDFTDAICRIKQLSKCQNRDLNGKYEKYTWNKIVQDSFVPIINTVTGAS